jgi:hypothetical protein
VDDHLFLHHGFFLFQLLRQLFALTLGPFSLLFRFFFLGCVGGCGGGLGGASLSPLLLMDLAEALAAFRAASIFGLRPRTIFIYFATTMMYG